MKETNYRISDIRKNLMIGTSAGFDLVELVLGLAGGIGLILNRAVVFIKITIFVVWFWMSGIYILNFKDEGTISGVSKKILKWGAEMLPIIGSLPVFTFMVVAEIKKSRQEDEKKGVRQKTAVNRVYSRDRLRALARAQEQRI